MEPNKYQPVDPRMIKKLRNKLKLKQAEMAEIIGCNRSELSLIENGKVTPDWLERFIKLSRLMQAAGMSWEDVVMEFPDAPSIAAESPGTYQID